MADTSVLDPFSTKPRETMELNPRNQVGGSMEYVEELLEGTADLIFKGPEGPFVNQEGPVIGAGEVFIGGQKEIIFNDPVKVQYQKALSVVAHYGRIDQNVEQVKQVRAAEEDARFEANVMPDEEFAKKADYKNIGFRGALRTIANRMYVFTKLVAEKLQLIKEKAPPVKIISKRTSSKAAVSGANDNLLLNTSANEGQSAVAQFSRGAS